MAGGGFYYYQQTVVIPKRIEAREAAKAAAEEKAKAEAEAKAKEAEKKQAEENELKKGAKTKGIIVGTKVFIRSGPGQNFDTMGYFYNGEDVIILKVAENWYQVRRANGTVGWVYNQYCRTN